MGLKSFYFGIKTAPFFFAGLRPAPRCRPPDHRVRPQRPQNLKLGCRQKSPLPVQLRKKQRFIALRAVMTLQDAFYSSAGLLPGDLASVTLNLSRSVASRPVSCFRPVYSILFTASTHDS